MSSDYMPQYTIVSNGIIQKIHDGLYRPGVKLPGVRRLAEEYGVGRQVAHYALTYLAQHDYVYAEPKRGVFVNPRLKPGRFYRLALYIANINPVQLGLLMHLVAVTALNADCEVILLSNFNNGVSLAEHLNRDARYDGLLLSGEVDEKLLMAIAPFRIPYMVLGNYEIAPEHPQQRIDLKRVLAAELAPEFQPFAGKRIAALMGDPSYAADREATEAVRAAIVAAGAVYVPELVVNVTSDGYAECCALFEKSPFDMLYIHGCASSGYRKYCEQRKLSTRPFVICNMRSPKSDPHPGLWFDRKISTVNDQEELGILGTSRLLELIETRTV